MTEVERIAAGLTPYQQVAFLTVGKNQPDGTSHLLCDYSKWEDVKAWGAIEDVGCATIQVYPGDGVAYRFNKTGLAVRAHLQEPTR